jgi:hypothetical protein
VCCIEDSLWPIHADSWNKHIQLLRGNALLLVLLTHVVLHLYAQAVRRPTAWLQRLLQLQQLLLL